MRGVTILVSLLCAFIIGAVAGGHGNHRLPVCQEDEVYIGGGDYIPQRGWEWLQCGPARDDITPRDFDWSR